MLSVKSNNKKKARAMPPCLVIGLNFNYGGGSSLSPKSNTKTEKSVQRASSSSSQAYVMVIVPQRAWLRRTKEGNIDVLYEKKLGRNSRYFTFFNTSFYSLLGLKPCSAKVVHHEIWDSLPCFS
ncbi:unnamed protein product [Cuscuta epithymum]|uniref:Uncharacterized protein n=1 Tax=Cuscuta epithymum TaxID=186058 RepID=A0AAV0DCI0_9ASTE|nr:unnamed protein product [Cuscuta epithymum]